MASLRQTARGDQEIPRAARVEPVRVGPRAADVGTDVEAGPIVDRGHRRGRRRLDGHIGGRCGSGSAECHQASHSEQKFPHRILPIRRFSIYLNR